MRNRVKRRLRHLVAPRLATLPAPADIVIRALPAAASEPHRLAGDLDSAWEALRRALVGDPAPAVATSARTGRRA